MGYLIGLWAVYGMFILVGIGFAVHLIWFKKHRTTGDGVISLFLLIGVVLYLLFVGGMGWDTIMSAATDSRCS